MGRRLSRKKILNNYFMKSLWKQLYADVHQNSCSQNFCNIHRKTSMLQSLFNKVARYIPVNTANLLQTAFFIQHLPSLLLSFLLRIHQRPITNVSFFLLTSCCSRMRLLEVCLIYFKFTRLFFYLMFLIKETNKLINITNVCSFIGCF